MINQGRSRKCAEFVYGCTPDTGATKSVCGQKVVKEYGLKVDAVSAGHSLLDASGRRMKVLGTVSICITPQVKGNCLEAPTNIKITALVTEAVGWDLLLGWQDLQKLGVIHASFPLPQESCRKTIYILIYYHCN